MTPAQRKRGLKLPEPRGTLKQQNDWYARMAQERAADRAARAAHRLANSQMKERPR